MILVIRWLIVILVAFGVGKLVSKIKLPSILGWLITGMILGPNAVALLPEQLIQTGWYEIVVHILECGVGLMIGTELVWSRIRQYGKALIVTTLTQSLGTFALVSAGFCLAFVIEEVPLYLAFVFGGIALATAPAPALSIVKEFRTEGPVTRTLIPMAALDDMVGVAVFFTTISIVAGRVSGGGMSAIMIPVMILLPLLIGILPGLLGGILLKKETSKGKTLVRLISMILVTSLLGYLCNNYLMPSPMLNYMLMGMAFSATFSNMVSEKRLEQIVQDFNPILGVSMIIVILNLGAPLDYHAILGAGMFAALYILAERQESILVPGLAQGLQKCRFRCVSILALPCYLIREFPWFLQELQFPYWQNLHRNVPEFFKEQLRQQRLLMS